MRGFRTLIRHGALASAALALATLASASRAQEPAAADPGPQFGPGVLTTIEPAVDRFDAISVHNVIELASNQALKWQPSKWLKWESATTAPTNRTLLEMAQGAAFAQDVWCLEFSFKPLRMIEADVPQGNGRVQRKQVWYMVYRVRNTGAGLSAEVQPDGEFATAAKAADQVKFMPQFILVSHDHDGSGGQVRKAYLDRILPTAMASIEQREQTGKLLNSVQISEQSLPVESGRAQRGAWGVAMWEDVDPEIDFFSVYVGGLTDAYQWNDPDGAYQAGDPPGKGRKIVRKMLQLNFWRPGDSLNPNEREVRYGAAPGEGERYGGGEGVAYRWVYR